MYKAVKERKKKEKVSNNKGKLVTSSDEND